MDPCQIITQIVSRKLRHLLRPPLSRYPCETIIPKVDLCSLCLDDEQHYGLKKGLVMATIVCVLRTGHRAMVHNIYTLNYTYYTTTNNGTVGSSENNATKVKAKHCSNTFLHNHCPLCRTEIEKKPRFN